MNESQDIQLMEDNRLLYEFLQIKSMWWLIMINADFIQS